jgi:hypothetical protein
MDVRIINCIRKYIKEKYVGGVIKISDIARHCQISEGRVIKGLVELEDLGEGKIEKRYSCPEFHTIKTDEMPFCGECDYEYPQEQINVYFYFKPLVLAGK